MSKRRNLLKLALKLGKEKEWGVVNVTKLIFEKSNDFIWRKCTRVVHTHRAVVGVINKLSLMWVIDNQVMNR